MPAAVASKAGEPSEIVMPHPLEAVYKDTDLRGPEKAIMAYLVYRANDAGICWPSNSAIETECGISRNTRKRAMAHLEEMGRITTQETGHGRGNRNTIRVCDMYIKGVRINPLSDNKRGQNKPLLEKERGSELTPLNQEKGSNLTEKGSNLNVEEQEELINNNNSSDPVRILLSRFEELTVLAPPHHSSTEYQEKWRGPFVRWLSHCDNDPDRVVELMTAAHSQLINNGTGKRYTIKSPSSLDVAVSNLLATRSVTLPAGPNYEQDFDTYFPLMASRHASLRDANAPEYVINAMITIGRGEFQNCTEFNKSRLRTRFINLAREYYQQVPS